MFPREEKALPSIESLAKIFIFSSNLLLSIEIGLGGFEQPQSNVNKIIIENRFFFIAFYL